MMEHVRKRVLTNRKWRLQRCCCCRLKTGTTVLGLLEIIFTVLIIAFPSSETDTVIMRDEHSVKKVVQSKMSESLILLGFVRVVYIVLVATMVYGNMMNKSNLMIPYVNAEFIVLSGGIFFSCATALSYFFLGELITSLSIIIWKLLLPYALLLYAWHVVRCRILEIDELH